MSSVLMGWALRAIREEFQQLSTGARFTLLLLADHFNDDKGAAWPSHDRLALIMGVSRRSVIEYMKELKEAGIVTQKMEYGKVNLYTIGVKNSHTPCEESAQHLCKICTLTTYELLREQKANLCKICTHGFIEETDEAGYVHVKRCPNGCKRTGGTHAQK